MTGRHKRSKKPLTPLEKAQDTHWFDGGSCDSRLIYSRLVYENEYTTDVLCSTPKGVDMRQKTVYEYRCLRCGQLISVTG